jgi:hypothetical protein
VAKKSIGSRFLAIAYNFSLHDIQKIEPMNNLKDRIIINISKGVENNSTKIKIG